MAKKKKAATRKKKKPARRIRKPPTRKKARAARKPVVVVAVAVRELLPTVEAVGAADERLAALQEKRAALQKLDARLAVQVAASPAETIAIRRAREDIVDATRVLDARIVAARTQVLAPPSAADVAALRAAVGEAENAIAQNAAVNRLASATAALINAFNA